MTKNAFQAVSSGISTRKLFIDCGGFDGCSVVAFLLDHPDYDCVSFEPNPDLHGYYADLPTKLIPKAVYTHDGTKTFRVDDVDADGSTLMETKPVYYNDLERVAPKIEVDCVDLSAFVKQVSRQYDEIVLKLDVEGAEYDILERMLSEKTLNFVSRLYCEFHEQKMDIDLARHKSVLKQVEAICKVEDWDALPFAVVTEKNQKNRMKRAVARRNALVNSINLAKAREQVRHAQCREEIAIATAALTRNTEALTRKRKKLQRLATYLAIPYLLLTLPISAPAYFYINRKHKKKKALAVKRARADARALSANGETGLALARFQKLDVNSAYREHKKIIDDVRFRLETLGLTEPALKEIQRIYETSLEPRTCAYAARELALFAMRERKPESYRRALGYLVTAQYSAGKADNVNERKIRSTIATSQLLCHLALEQRAEAAKCYAAVKKCGDANPDVKLAWAAFEENLSDRVGVINEALGEFDIPPVALNDDEAREPYDRLTLCEALPAVTDGPKVTVLIAAYEAEDTIDTALRSLQEQTWKNLEIIVIDDCSPNKATVTVAERLAAEDERIKVLRLKENGGAYVARNLGLDAATGKYVTLNDSDDWSHPKKIEMQVKVLEENEAIIATTTQQARANNDLCFTRWTGRGQFIITNVSSLMFRRKQVQERLGYWDTARFSADKELIRRMIAIWGEGSVLDIKSGPLSFQRNWERSIVADNTLGINGFIFGARKEYLDSQQFFHAKGQNLKYTGTLGDRPFPAPAIMRSDRNRFADQHVPVVIASDFRMHGGSVRSCIQEILATREAGFDVGIFEMFRYDLNARRAMLPDVRALVDGTHVNVLCYGDKVSCDLLVLRYPPILEHLHRYVPTVEAENIAVVVNQPPVSDYSERGVERYNLEHCANNLRAYFGKDAVWYPNGPMVREAIVKNHSEQLHHIELAPENWDNIIHLPDWQRTLKPSGAHGALRIGRHSRDSYVKWPDKAEDILALYPEDPDVEIHVMGGAQTATELLGRLPSNWVVHQFGAMSAKEFLSEIDVFVFFTHPDWVESFPRVVLEAMAVGVPVVLPHSHEPLFGDNALYATPQSATEVIRKLHENPDAYLAQVRKAWNYLDQNYSYAMHAGRLRNLGVGASMKDVAKTG